MKDTHPTRAHDTHFAGSLNYTGRDGLKAVRRLVLAIATVSFLLPLLLLAIGLAGWALLRWRPPSHDGIEEIMWMLMGWRGALLWSGVSLTCGIAALVCGVAVLITNRGAGLAVGRKMAVAGILLNLTLIIVSQAGRHHVNQTIAQLNSRVDAYPPSAEQIAARDETRRISDILQALRWFAADHAGRYPADLPEFSDWVRLKGMFLDASNCDYFGAGVTSDALSPARRDYNRPLQNIIIIVGPKQLDGRRYMGLESGTYEGPHVVAIWPQELSSWFNPDAEARKTYNLPAVNWQDHTTPQ